MPAVTNPVIKAYQLTLTQATSKIVPGATSLSLRNNADSADNVLVSDAGAVTVRAGLTITAGGAAIGGGATITGSLAVTSSVTINNGQYFRAKRNTGSAEINVLGFRAGTDVLSMTISGNFEIENTGALVRYTFADTGNLTMSGGLTATTGTLTAAAPTVAAGQVGLGATTQTTVGAAGAASALPANPTGYLIVNIAGTNRVIPFYASA